MPFFFTPLMVLAVRSINKIQKGQRLGLEKPKPTMWADRALFPLSATFQRKRSAQHPQSNSRAQACNQRRRGSQVPCRSPARFSVALGSSPGAKFKMWLSWFVQAPFPLLTHLLLHVVNNSAFHPENNLPERSTVTFGACRPMKCQDCNTRCSRLPFGQKGQAPSLDQ